MFLFVLSLVFNMAIPFGAYIQGVVTNAPEDFNLFGGDMTLGRNDINIIETGIYMTGDISFQNGSRNLINIDFSSNRRNLRFSNIEIGNQINNFNVNLTYKPEKSFTYTPDLVPHLTSNANFQSHFNGNTNFQPFGTPFFSTTGLDAQGRPVIYVENIGVTYSYVVESVLQKDDYLIVSFRNFGLRIQLQNPDYLIDHIMGTSEYVGGGRSGVFLTTIGRTVNRGQRVARFTGNAEHISAGEDAGKYRASVDYYLCLQTTVFPDSKQTSNAPDGQNPLLLDDSERFVKLLDTDATVLISPTSQTLYTVEFTPHLTNAPEVSSPLSLFYLGGIQSSSSNKRVFNEVGDSLEQINLFKVGSSDIISTTTLLQGQIPDNFFILGDRIYSPSDLGGFYNILRNNEGEITSVSNIMGLGTSPVWDYQPNLNPQFARIKFRGVNKKYIAQSDLTSDSDFNFTVYFSPLNAEENYPVDTEEDKNFKIRAGSFLLNDRFLVSQPSGSVPDMYFIGEINPYNKRKTLSGIGAINAS